MIYTTVSNPWESNLLISGKPKYQNQKYLTHQVGTFDKENKLEAENLVRLYIESWVWHTEFSG